MITQTSIIYLLQQFVGYLMLSTNKKDDRIWVVLGGLILVFSGGGTAKKSWLDRLGVLKKSLVVGLQQKQQALLWDKINWQESTILGVADFAHIKV